MATNSSVSAEYRGTKLLIFTAVFMPIQPICVGLRVVSRSLNGAWGMDDIVILASLACQIGMGGITIGQ